MFPIQDGADIPWGLIGPHEKQAEVNHGQSLERLAERHGLSRCEAIAIIEDRRWERMGPDFAAQRLMDLVSQRATDTTSNGSPNELQLPLALRPSRDDRCDSLDLDRGELGEGE